MLSSPRSIPRLAPFAPPSVRHCLVVRTAPYSDHITHHRRTSTISHLISHLCLRIAEYAFTPLIRLYNEAKTAYILIIVLLRTHTCQTMIAFFSRSSFPHYYTLKSHNSCYQRHK